MNLSAEHVSVLRGRTEIVHDVSFSVSDGQWLMICGPNGAGKSTLLSAVSQELPYTGLVTLDSTDLRRMKPRQLARRMAMLRQLSDLAYAYTVEEVVAMGRYAHRGLLQADSGGAEAVERALQAVQLQDKRRQNILTLSGGERQRMLLAQVLCQEPDVLLWTNPATIWICASSRNYSCSSMLGGANRGTRWYPSSTTCPLRGSSARTRFCFRPGAALTAKFPPS